MNIRFTIPWKIGLGFGLFMVSVAVLFVITRNTLQNSRVISEEINSVITPGIESLEQLTARVAYSKVLIRHWGTVQSRSNIPEKTRLLELMEREIPEDLDRIDSIARRWNVEQKSNATQLRRSVQRLFIVYRQIMVHLPNFESYADPAAMMKVD